jgi:hypothetical protein
MWPTNDNAKIIVSFHFLKFHVIGGQNFLFSELQKKLTKPEMQAIKVSFFVGLILLMSVNFTTSLKPIIFMHGLMGSGSNFDNITESILTQYPNTTVFSLPIYEAENSSG